MLLRILTIIAVAALAVGSWILSSPSRAPGAQQAGAENELPGYYLKNTVLIDYDPDGNPSVRIEAQRIDQIDHGSDIALHDVRVVYEAPGAQTWTMLGDQAHVGGGGKIVDVTGNVRVEGESPKAASSAVIHTDTLRYDVSTAIASTASDVRIDYGSHVLTAHGMVANLKDRTLRLESKVNGRFHR